MRTRVYGLVEEAEMNPIDEFLLPDESDLESNIANKTSFNN